MPWFKKDPNIVQQFVLTDWEEVEKVTSTPENGSSRVAFVNVSSDEISKRQLDPRIVDLQNLIDNGITIDPGQTFEMLNITDMADIEQFNRSYVQDAYKFLKENSDKIFKSNVETKSE